MLQIELCLSYTCLEYPQPWSYLPTATEAGLPPASLFRLPFPLPPGTRTGPVSPMETSVPTTSLTSFFPFTLLVLLSAALWKFYLPHFVRSPDQREPKPTPGLTLSLTDCLTGWLAIRILPSISLSLPLPLLQRHSLLIYLLFLCIL